MVKLIQNIPCANDGKQHKDNDINITKYLEFNKDTVLNLAEKNYKNLLEALTNNSISSAVVSSSILRYHCRNHSLHSQSHRTKVVHIEKKSQKFMIIAEAILLIDMQPPYWSSYQR